VVLRGPEVLYRDVEGVVVGDELGLFPTVTQKGVKCDGFKRNTDRMHSDTSQAIKNKCTTKREQVVKTRQVHSQGREIFTDEYNAIRRGSSMKLPGAVK
jgi:hypothetical protein